MYYDILRVSWIAIVTCLTTQKIYCIAFDAVAVFVFLQIRYCFNINLEVIAFFHLTPFKISSCNTFNITLDNFCIHIFRDDRRSAPRTAFRRPVWIIIIYESVIVYSVINYNLFNCFKVERILIYRLRLVFLLFRGGGRRLSSFLFLCSGCYRLSYLAVAQIITCIKLPSESLK